MAANQNQRRVGRNLLMEEAAEAEEREMRKEIQMARQVCFVDRLQFRWKHRTFPKALVLGDMDNDGIIELALGSIGGVLLIWKGAEPVPWRTCDSLGTITTLAVGDLYNKGKNVLLVVNGEGICHIFDFSIGEKLKEKDPSTKEPVTIEPCATHHVPTNTCAILVADYDGDGNVEVIFGTSDNIVYALQFTMGVDESAKRMSVSLPGFEKSTKKEKGRWRLSQPISSLTFCPHPEIPAIVAALKDGNYAVLSEYNSEKKGTANGDWVKGFEDGKSPNMREAEVPQDKGKEKEKEKEKEQEASGKGNDKSRRYSESDKNRRASYYPTMYEASSDMEAAEIAYDLDSGWMDQNFTQAFALPTEAIIPNTRRKIPLIAVATLEGQVELRDLQLSQRQASWAAYREKRKTVGRKTRLSTDYLLAQLMGDTSVWRFAVEDQIFALGVADVTGDGEQEVIACSWDGMTYIFNYKKELVKFHFGNPVCAFCVGMYTIDGRDVPCFVYVSQEGYIWVYYNVRLRSLSMMTARALLREDLQDYALLKTNPDIGEWEEEEQRQLIASCLYHFPPEEEVSRYIASLKEKLKAQRAEKTLSSAEEEKD